MPNDIAPDETAIRWQVSGDGILDVLDAHWPKVEVCVRELQANYERDVLNLTDEERTRGVQQRGRVRGQPVGASSSTGRADNHERHGRRGGANR